MNFEELSQSRFSVRSYTDRSVPKDSLLKLVEAGRLAPSAVNLQPWHFIVVTTAEKREQLHDVYQRDWFKQAPAYIIVCTHQQQGWTRNSDHKNFAEVDAAIATEHIILQATDMGLGSCWVCNFDVESCKQILQLPTGIDPLVIIPIGYTTAKAPDKKRKAIEAIVHWEKFTGV